MDRGAWRATVLEVAEWDMSECFFFFFNVIQASAVRMNLRTFACKAREKHSVSLYRSQTGSLCPVAILQGYMLELVWKNDCCLCLSITMEDSIPKDHWPN